jgi:hypothetical protein
METNFLLDIEYKFGKLKSKHRCLHLINQGIIVKKSFKGGIIATKILLAYKGRKKYLKCILMWFSILMWPKKGFSSKMFANNSDFELIFFGRCKRIKVIKAEGIVNKVNSDYFSKTDRYIRKKINTYNIAPKVFEFGNNYFYEERVKKFDYARNIDVVNEKLLHFKSLFQTIIISKTKYKEKLVKRINSFDKSILITNIKNESGNIKVNMSHGDLVRRNILVKDKKNVFIIDFEFCGYRSECYDFLFEDYYNDRKLFFEQHPNFQVNIFLLERVILILKLQNELKISYQTEIQAICEYLQKHN